MVVIPMMNELRIAALMHDTGKITTPEHIIGKSSKLEAVFDRIELIRTRFELFKTQNELAAEKQMGEQNEIDIDIVRLNFDTRPHLAYAQKHLFENKTNISGSSD